MNEISVKDLADKIADVATHKLSDSSVPTRLLDLSKDASATAGSIKALLSASLDLTIDLYNDSRDTDDGGVIGTPSTTPPRQATTEWPPQIPFSDTNTWLGYALSGKATAAASATIGVAGAAIDGDRTICLACYKKHDRTTQIGAAINKDLSALASPLSPADILELGVGEATALKIRGNLEASITLSWSDILSGTIALLGALTGGDRSSALIDIDTGASVSFKVTLSDDLTLCFTRRASSGDSPIHVAVRKSIDHDSRFAFKADVEVSFAHPDAVSAVLKDIFSGLLGISSKTIDAINKAPAIDRLAPDNQTIVRNLAKQLGITDLDPLSPLKKRLETIQSKIVEQIEKAATAKVGLGFQYEYARIATEASLFEANLSEKALCKWHASLLNFDLKPLLEQPGNGVELDFYLHAKTVERVQSWGFSLNLGSWLNVGSEQKRIHRFITRRYRTADDERVTLAYQGSTAYTTKANTWSTDSGATFKADLTEAVSPSKVSGTQFKCGLQLWWETSTASPKDNLDGIIDDAVLWGVIGSGDGDALRVNLHERVGAQKKCGLRLCATLSDYGLREAVRTISQVDDDTIALHFARALPQKNESLRASSEVRASSYTPFFRAYARDRGITGSEIRNLLSTTLRKYGGSIVGKEEQGQAPWTAYQVLLRCDADYQRFWPRWDDFRNGARRLSALLDGSGHWADFDDNFRLMCSSFEQSYLLRVTASLLAQNLVTIARDTQAYNVTLTLTYEDKGTSRSLVVA